ncbi:MAG: methyltransferase domain-containing protein [Clostridia bacterium]|nr:methyltransferase domain-containing protein [Clostridia bacterium]
MRIDAYKEFFKAEYMMGPNCLRLLDELLSTYPLQFTAENRILDLGCGKGVTSLFTAKETGATVYANDLWISEEENRARFKAWGMEDRLIPVHKDARDLHFEKEMFDALISIDAYHYFAGAEGFFAENILPFIKKGGTVLIAVPGMKTEFDGRSEELLTPWLRDEAYMFQSPVFWKRILGEHPDIEEVRTWEMDSFDIAWQEWLGTAHEYALGDLAHFDSLIKPYTCFVGMMVKKR